MGSNFLDHSSRFIMLKIMRQVITSSFPFLTLCGDQINRTLLTATLVLVCSTLEKYILLLYFKKEGCKMSSHLLCTLSVSLVWTACLTR